MPGELFYKVVEPEGAAPKATVVLLHGRGSHEDDLLGLAPHLEPPLRFVAVRAPYPLQLGGFRGYAWYELGEVGAPHEGTFEESLARLLNLLEGLRQELGICARDLLLLGFSQGAVMSFSAALTRPEAVGGVVGLSGYVPAHLARGARGPAGPHLGGLPVLITHGTYDAVIPVGLGRAARDLLAERGADVTYHEFPMGHEVNPECLDAINRWLAGRLAGGA